MEPARLEKVVGSDQIERAEVLVHIALDPSENYRLRIHSEALEVCVEEAAGRKGAGLLPDVAAARRDYPVLTGLGELAQVLALLVFMQPLLPAVGLVDGLVEHVFHVGKDGYAAFSLIFDLQLFQFA